MPELINSRVIAGQQAKEVPDSKLCLAQAALIFTTPTLSGFTILALVIQVPSYLSFRSLYADNFTTVRFGNIHLRYVALTVARYRPLSYVFSSVSLRLPL